MKFIIDYSLETDVILVLAEELTQCFHLNMMIPLIWVMNMVVSMDNMELLMNNMKVVPQWLDVVLVLTTHNIL